jgi:hypothetical protein
MGGGVIHAKGDTTPRPPRPQYCVHGERGSVRAGMRDQARRRARRARLAGVGAVVLLLAAIGLTAGYLVAKSSTDAAAPRSSATRPTSTATSTSTTATTTTPTTQSSSSTAVQSGPPKPVIVPQMIPLPSRRLAETATYAKRHYGVATYRLHPRLIVLHFTASGAGTEPGVHSLFASDVPNGGELPGVCAHFVVDQDGTIYQQAPLDVICRNAIGVNDHAIGIEMVQETGSSSHWADQQILHRPAQIHAVLALVRWLRSRFHIPLADVIGHSMANDSPFFHDLEGWRNDHSDWQVEDVRQLRALL